ncbi:uncharacterized protein LOC143586363 [Bidens hawaiensis]|uniref:uncharacterized protein LOC143586363 n=1 Tax=Bidens hawaiensis TaxID=980011 RepID=UPI00404AF3EF
MGCGKSKHAVETATTVIKSTNSYGTKHTATATRTVKETTTGSSLIQKESLHVEDINTSYPSAVASTLALENLQPEDDVKVNDSNPTDNAAPTSAEVVRGDEKVNDSSPTDGSIVSTVVPTSSKDDVGTPEVVKGDEGKRESALTADTNAKTDNVVPAEQDKTKESNLTTDNKTKNEFLTPTLSEEVVGPFDVAKGNEEVKDSKDEKHVNTGDGPKEQELVVQASESTKVQVKKDEEAVEVTETDIVKAKISVPTETEKATTTSEPNVAETREKKP